MACLPGFMPGMAAIHGRFGTKPWKDLVAPAIPWAEDGFPLDEFTRGVLEFELDGNTYFPSMRELYAPNGFTPSVGERLKNPALAKTLRRLQAEGPEYFTKGEWAQHFVETANSSVGPSRLTISLPTRRAGVSLCATSIAATRSFNRPHRSGRAYFAVWCSAS